MNGKVSERLEKVFVLSAAVILSCTAVAKLVSVTGAARLLDEANPILVLSNRNIMFMAGVWELAVACYLSLAKNRLGKLLAILWLSSCFLAYRFGMFWLSPGTPCPCLGTLTERLHLSTGASNFLLELTVVFLLGGSLYFLIVQKLPVFALSRSKSREANISQDGQGGVLLR